MNRSQYEAWIKENCTGSTTEWINQIEYKFGQMLDGWTAVFERTETGDYMPLTQAKDLEHARSFCNMREPVTVPVSFL